MIIILDGPDGAGKSTLATQLASWLNSVDGRPVMVAHHGPYQHLNGAELSKVLFRSMAPALVANTHVIMDRCWLSEPIYAKAYGRDNRLLRSHHRMLERCALAASAQLVLCLPSFEVCHAAWSSGREEYIKDVEAFRGVHDAYHDVPRQTDLPWHMFDYTQDSTENLKKALLASPANIGPGAGAWRPGRQVVLVGDRPNMKGHGAETIIVPFINFNGSGCSEWLADQLEAEGIDERDLYWINATNARGEVTNPSFLDDLQPRAVVAMGNTAASWCEAHNIRAVEVPHPQHHKRFFYNRRYKLTDAIKEALYA
jgi:hypothetical protein